MVEDEEREPLRRRGVGARQAARREDAQLLLCPQEAVAFALPIPFPAVVCRAGGRLEPQIVVERLPHARKREVVVAGGTDRVIHGHVSICFRDKPQDAKPTSRRYGWTRRARTSGHPASP